MLTATTLRFDNTIILFVFAIIVLILGIYVLYTAREMKKTQVPPTFLIPEKEAARIKRKAEYCAAIRSSVIGIGLTCILYGAFEMFEYLFLNIYFAKMAAAAALFVVIIWLFARLSRIRGDYTQ